MKLDLSSARVQVFHALSKPEFSPSPFAKQEDQNFYHALLQGVWREWFWLESVLKRYAAKKTKPTVKQLFFIAAYQLLFLDRVPSYAVFTEVRAHAEHLGLSPPEMKFLHAILKSVEREKAELLKAKASIRAVDVLPKELIDVCVEGKKFEVVARAFEEMHREPRVESYQLPNGEKRVQGLASQRLCKRAAEEIQVPKRGQILSILEMCSGKGGKLLGTLTALTERVGGVKNVPPMRWVAVDASSTQEEIFRKDTFPRVREIWPQVDLLFVSHDWMKKIPERLEAPFDFIWIDAPCTGFGTLSKLPEIAVRRGPVAKKAVADLAKIQRRLLEVAAEREPRRLLYSVCTFTKPETDDAVAVAEKLLNRKPLWAELLLPGQPPLPNTEGFFSALF